MSVNPLLQALVLADHIYTDRITGKNVIAGTFNQLWSKKFPASFSRTTFAYVCLTDFRGRIDVELKYVDLSDQRILMQMPSVPVESDDPLRNVELAVEIPPFPMPHPGVYAFELYANDQMLGSLRLRVDEFEGGEE